MSAHKELYDFVEFWHGKEGFEVHPNGNCEFLGQVTFEAANETEADTTTVRLIRNGYNDGKVSLAETDVLSAARFHLDFSPDYQAYEFRSADGALVISGKSSKMGGAYCVTLLPAA
ncbi:hypothetical protein [Trinickia diaoshuihuensis]|uniref:hypothetical protein n=1 Tax=Trinickia diaoshuihuensis TaxID=2292265 RepID=UPI000E233A22|nr:hypothetical protein [Trinickia diaoshuihuensis]